MDSKHSCSNCADLEKQLQEQATLFRGERYALERRITNMRRELRNLQQPRKQPKVGRRRG